MAEWKGFAVYILIDVTELTSLGRGTCVPISERESLLPKPSATQGFVTLFDFANLMGEMLCLITILYCVYFSWGRADTSSDGQEPFLFCVGELSFKSFTLFNFPGALLASYLAPSRMVCPHYEDIWHCDQITWLVEVNQYHLYCQEWKSRCCREGSMSQHQTVVRLHFDKCAILTLPQTG